MTSSDALDARIPRAPSSTLVVDANIVLGIVLGRRRHPLFRAVTTKRNFVTSLRTAEEIIGVLPTIPLLSSDVLSNAETLLSDIKIAPTSLYANALEMAAKALRQAVPSLNGTTNDAHVLACAWAYDADIWSHDRDFAGTGWPSWSSRNLRDALETEIIEP